MFLREEFADGEGTFKYSNRSKYEGYWKNGQRDGHGVQVQGRGGNASSSGGRPHSCGGGYCTRCGTGCAGHDIQKAVRQFQLWGHCAVRAQAHSMPCHGPAGRYTSGR